MGRVGGGGGRDPKRFRDGGGAVSYEHAGCAVHIRHLCKPVNFGASRNQGRWLPWRWEREFTGIPHLYETPTPLGLP